MSRVKRYIDPLNSVVPKNMSLPPDMIPLEGARCPGPDEEFDMERSATA